MTAASSAARSAPSSPDLLSAWRTSRAVKIARCAVSCSRILFRVAPAGQLRGLVLPRDRGALGDDLFVLHLAARVMAPPAPPGARAPPLQSRVRENNPSGTPPSGYPNSAPRRVKCRSPLLAKSGFISRAFLPKPSPVKHPGADQHMRVRVVVVTMDRPLDGDAVFLRLQLTGDELQQHRLTLFGRRLARQSDGHVLGDLPALLPAQFAGLPVQRLLGALGLAPDPRRIRRPFRRVFRQNQPARLQLAGAMREVEAFAALIEAGVAGDIGRQAGGAAAGAGLDNLHAGKPARHRCCLRPCAVTTVKITLA